MGSRREPTQIVGVMVRNRIKDPTDAGIWFSPQSRLIGLWSSDGQRDRGGQLSCRQLVLQQQLLEVKACCDRQEIIRGPRFLQRSDYLRKNKNKKGTSWIDWSGLRLSSFSICCLNLSGLRRMRPVQNLLEESSGCNRTQIISFIKILRNIYYNSG